MKGIRFKIWNKYMTIIVVIFFLLAESCDLSEFGKVKDVKVKTETKLALPFAYGSIKIKNLIDYIGFEDSTFIPFEDGSFSFEPSITEIQFPDTFAFKGSLLDPLSHLELRIETVNSLPLGISVELIFYDAILFTKFGTPIKCSLLEPGIIDKTGKVTEASHHIENVILTKELILEYQKAERLMANIRFYLPENNFEKIYISQEDSLSLNVGVIVQANTNED